MKQHEITIKYLVNYSDNGTAIGAEVETQVFTAYTLRGAVAKAKMQALHNITFFYKPLGVVVVDFTAYPMG